MDKTGGILVWVCFWALPLTGELLLRELKELVPADWRRYRVLEQLLTPGRAVVGLMRRFAQLVVGAKPRVAAIKFPGELIAEKYYGWTCEGLWFAGFRDGLIWIAPVMLMGILFGGAAAMWRCCEASLFCHGAWRFLLVLVLIYLSLCISFQVTLTVKELLEAWQPLVLLSVVWIGLLATPIANMCIDVLWDVIRLWGCCLLLAAAIVVALWIRKKKRNFRCLSLNKFSRLPKLR